MNAVFKITAGAVALGFVVLGLSWWMAPEIAGTLLRMELQGGVGLSTQIADLAAFFLTLGGAILIGLVSTNRFWFYPPIMLIGFAVVGRLVAWLFHGADFAAGMIAAEAVVIAILLFNLGALGKQKV
jgi:hypothetical protein